MILIDLLKWLLGHPGRAGKPNLWQLLLKRGMLTKEAHHKIHRENLDRQNPAGDYYSTRGKVEAGCINILSGYANRKGEVWTR